MITRMFLVIAICLASLTFGTPVLAQEEVPPPYAGLENPFLWNDVSAQAAGNSIYRQYCLGCHGVTGNGHPRADFSVPDYPERLENRPDLYYWLLTEGKMDFGMPAFKSSLSDEQRWQVLTYIWSLGMAGPVLPPPGVSEAGLLQVNSVAQVETGQPLTMTAILLDTVGKPITGATVDFLAKEQFFIDSLMKVGDAVTDSQGIATFEYTPRRAEKLEVVARYGNTEATTVALVTESGTQFYHVEVGMKLPALGPRVFIGPQTALEPTVGQAPTSALRLPGGLFSGLWLFVLAMALIWGTYFIVMYQVLRIPAIRKTHGLNLRLVPQISLAIVVVLGILVVLKIVTGPYSQFHVPPY